MSKKNDISIKAVDGILDHNKRPFFTSFLGETEKKLSVEEMKKRKEYLENKIKEDENKIKEDKNKIKEKIDKLKQNYNVNDENYSYIFNEKENKKEKDKIEKNKIKYEEEIKKIDLKINKEQNKIHNKDKDDKSLIKDTKSNATSLTSLFNNIVSNVNNKTIVNKEYYNKDVCFDVDNFNDLMNLIFKVIFFIIIIFLILIFLFSLLNLILIIYYVINDNINIYFNNDYVLGYVYTYKIIADMITDDSIYLFINSSEKLVFNNFIIIIIIIFIIIISYIYAFLKIRLCNNNDDNSYVKGNIHIDKKYIFLLCLIFIFLLFHFLIFKYFYGYIINIYSEIFKTQMDMSKKIGKMISSTINKEYIDIFIKNNSYEDINKYLYTNNIINSSELNNYLLVFNIFDYLSNIDKTLIKNYLNDNLNNNFFELLSFKDPSLMKKDYQKLNFLSLDNEKLNIKQISDQLIILNNNINNINNFIIENNKLNYPSYLVLIYCLIIIFLIIITLLSIYKINDIF